MNNQRLVLRDPQSISATKPMQLLGHQLVDNGHIAPSDLAHALELQSKMEAQPGEILIAESLITTNTLLEILEIQSNAQHFDLERDPLRDALSNSLPTVVCLQYGLVSWLRIANTLLVAKSRPINFEKLRLEIGHSTTSLLPVVADPRQIQAQITKLYGEQLAEKAITRVPISESCRNWSEVELLKSKKAAAIGELLLLSIILFPFWALTILVL